MLSKVAENIFVCNLDNKNILRKVPVKIELERINIQKEITVEILLDSKLTELVISLEFARKQNFKLKKIEKLIYVRNLNSSLNKEEPIEYIVEVNIVRNRPATEPVMLKVCNVKLSFDIWLVLYMYFILYS